MVLTIANVWKTFAVARDLSDDIDNTMKCTRKTALALGKKDNRTKSKKKTRKRRQGIWKGEKYC